MSGGSYDYVCFKISDIELRNCLTDPRRAAFQKLLKLIGQAMYAIEWVDSCDWGPGDEHKDIDRCFAFLQADPEIIRKAHAYDAMRDSFKAFLLSEHNSGLTSDHKTD